ncbi:flavin reductase [Rickettsiales bacterium]|nr:flavin reductase [Rickettsiales bacterium]
MEIENFKECLSKFATGVVVVTTVDRSGAMWGITINSFNSVSLRPPLILFSIEKKASRYNKFIEHDRFIVNILSEKQADLSSLFAARNPDPWHRVPYSVNNLGVPILQGILSYLDCEIEHLYEGGDHKIIVGRVIVAKKVSDAHPLLYFNRLYYELGKQYK